MGSMPAEDILHIFSSKMFQPQRSASRVTSKLGLPVYQIQRNHEPKPVYQTQIYQKIWRKFGSIDVFYNMIPFPLLTYLAVPVIRKGYGYESWLEEMCSTPVYKSKLNSVCYLSTVFISVK